MVYPHVKYLGPAHPDRSNTRGEGMIRELDSRISDGIYVRLLWHIDNGRVSVTVDDAKTGEAFELPVREGERALEVFRHPYAYAARGSDADAIVGMRSESATDSAVWANLSSRNGK
jgi:hypothetical protein